MGKFEIRRIIISESAATLSQRLVTYINSAKGFSLEYVEKSDGVITYIKAKKGLNWSSHGEIITINLEKTPDEKTSVRIKSECVLKTQVFDWGVNSRNIKELEVALYDNGLDRNADIYDKPHRSRFKKKRQDSLASRILAVIIIIVLLGFFAAKISTIDSGTKVSTNVELSPNEYKASCKEISYDELARNPNKYKGSDIVFTGRVIQVQEGPFDTTTYRISTSEGEYKLWTDDVVYATYKTNKGKNRILENDMIKFYGTFPGLKTYTAVLGNTITVPQVEINYVEFLSKN